MKFPVGGTGGDFQILEAGSHAAVLTQIVYIGMQTTSYLGVEKEVDQVKFRFEVPAERVTWTTKDGEENEGPMVIWSTYTASMYKMAKLRKHIEGWIGVLSDPEAEMFDVETLLGKGCLINVVHRESNGKVYANIDSISRLMKGMEPPVAEGDVLVFNCYDHTPEELEKLPQWLQEKVLSGLALRDTQRERVRAGVEQVAHSFRNPEPESKGDNFEDDDIPF